jgi:hypothetical protein
MWLWHDENQKDMNIPEGEYQQKKETQAARKSAFLKPRARGGEGEAQESSENGASPHLSNEFQEKLINAKNAKIRAIVPGKDCLVEKAPTEANGVNGGKPGMESSVSSAPSCSTVFCFSLDAADDRLIQHKRDGWACCQFEKMPSAINRKHGNI